MFLFINKDRNKRHSVTCNFCSALSFFRVHELRRIDLVNIRSLTLLALTPLRPGYRLNRRLECLWLGMKPGDTTAGLAKTNDHMDNEVLEFLLDSGTVSVLIVALHPSLIQCDPTVIVET